MLKTIYIDTRSRFDLVNISHKVFDIIKESGVKEGRALLFVPHTTAGITINENADPSVVSDMKKTLNKIVPENYDYKHMEGNSQAHILSTLSGASEDIIISEGKALLGTWQGIYFAEYDGPRKRKVYIKITEG